MVGIAQYELTYIPFKKKRNSHTRNIKNSVNFTKLLRNMFFSQRTNKHIVKYSTDFFNIKIIFSL